MNKPFSLKKIISQSLTVAFVIPISTVNSLSYTADKNATAKELGLMDGFPPPPDKQVTKANAIQNAPYNRGAYQTV